MSTDESGVEKAPKSRAPQGEKPPEKSSDSSEPKTAVSQPPELDENKINAPSKHDLIMLGVICVATLILWAAGRAACNYQVPGESLTPRKVSLEERTHTPKDVGIEFAQAMSGGDFAIAASLARADAASLVKKEKNECGECASRKKVAEKLLSVATVLKANLSDAIVSVKTIGGGSGETVRVLGIEREGRKWFVSRIYASAAEAQLKEPPAGAVDSLLGAAPDGAPLPSGQPSSNPNDSAPTAPAPTAPAPTAPASTAPASTAPASTPPATTPPAPTSPAPVPSAAPAPSSPTP